MRVRVSTDGVLTVEMDKLLLANASELVDHARGIEQAKNDRKSGADCPHRLIVIADILIEIRN